MPSSGLGRPPTAVRCDSHASSAFERQTGHTMVQPEAAQRDAEELEAVGALLEWSHRLAPDDLPVAVSDAVRAIGAKRAVMYAIDFEQRTLVALERPSETLDVDGTVAGRGFRQTQVVETSLDGGVRLWVPLLDGADRHGMLAIDFDGTVDDRRRKSCERIAAVVALLLVSKTALGDNLQLPRRRRPMTLAAEMRWALLPPLSFVNDRITIAGVLEPAYEIAGDTFDYALNGDVVHLALLDAMGHGLEASRIANVAVVAYRSCRRRGLDLLETLRAIDELVVGQFGPEKLVTGQLAQLDVHTGRLKVLSAGHPRPLLLRGGHIVGEVPCDATLPIGFGGIEGAVTEISLEPGDRVVFYTDGLVEARSPTGEEFGVQRLGDLVARAAASDEPPAETARRLVHSVLAHEAGNLRDDATVVLLGWPPAE